MKGIFCARIEHILEIKNLQTPREFHLSKIVLAFIGTTLSTFCIAGCAFIALQLSRLADLAPQEMKFNHCLQFGAMISATDPVTVLSIFKGKTSAKFDRFDEILWF